MTKGDAINLFECGGVGSASSMSLKGSCQGCISKTHDFQCNYVTVIGVGRESQATTQYTGVPVPVFSSSAGTEMSSTMVMAVNESITIEDECVM